MSLTFLLSSQCMRSWVSDKILLVILSVLTTTLFHSGFIGKVSILHTNYLIQIHDQNIVGQGSVWCSIGLFNRPGSWYLITFLTNKWNINYIIKVMKWTSSFLVICKGVEAAITFYNLGLPLKWRGALEWVFPNWARTHALDTGEAVNFLKGAVVTADRILTVSKVTLQS